MSADDMRAITRVDRERYMASIQNDLDTAWRAVLCLPEDHPRREVALQAIQSAWESNQALAGLIQDAEILIGGCYQVMNELRDQRDQAITELGDLTAAIEEVWTTRHPAVMTLYERLMDAHNSAFWESLPYDMAASLGGQWDFMDADLLYYIITVDVEEVSEDGSDYGFTPEQLTAFRANLLAFLKAFTARNGGSQ